MREPRVDTQTKNVRKNGKARQIFLEHTSKDWSLTSKDWPLNLQVLAAQRKTKWVHWWTFCYTNSSYLSWRPQDSGQKCPSKSMALNGRCIFWCVRVAVVDSMAVGILPFYLLQNKTTATTTTQPHTPPCFTFTPYTIPAMIANKPTLPHCRRTPISSSSKGL